MPETAHPEARPAWAQNPWARAALFVFVGLAFLFINHHLDLIATDLRNRGITWLYGWEHGVNQVLRRRVMFVGLFLVGAFLLAGRGPRRADSTAPLTWMVGAYLALAGASVLWTAHLMGTVSRVSALFCTVAMAWGLARCLSPRQVLQGVLAVGGAYLAFGLIVEVALYGWGLFALPHRFAGTLHPNASGNLYALIMTAALALYRGQSRHRLAYLALAAVFLLFVVLTKSRSALVSAVLAGSVLWLWRGGPARVMITLSLLFCGAAAALFVGGDLGDPLEPVQILMPRLSGEGTVFSGRLFIWDLMTRFVEQRPLLGWGYNTFWWVPEHVRYVESLAGWMVVEAHSGYMETVLGLGLSGLSLFIGILALSLGRAAHLARRNPGPGQLFALSVLLVVILSSVTESLFINTNFATFLFFWAVAWLIKPAPEGQ